MSNETLLYIGIIAALTAIIIVLILTHLIKSEYKKDLEHEEKVRNLFLGVYK